MTAPQGITRAATQSRRRLLTAAGSLWLILAAACGPPATDGPAPPHSRLPHLATDDAGRPVLSWVEGRDSTHRLVYSVRDDTGWRQPVTVAEGEGWYVNWADVPSVQPLTADLWAAHWLLERPGGMYSYDIAVSLSADGGSTWGRPFRPHRDDTPTEHGFVSLWPARSAEGAPVAGVVWLDGRHTLIDPSRSAPEDPRMTLRAAIFDAGGNELDAAELDGRVCECCRTDLTMTADGPVVAYRNRSADEIRDIHTAATDGFGWQTSGPVADDGWRVEGCPVNGPAIDSNEHGHVALAWYTEADGERQVQLVRRGPGGQTWSAPVRLDQAKPMGRVDVAVLDGGDAAVSWMSHGEAGARILLRRVSARQPGSAPLEVASVEASRQAGFPRMVRDGEGVVLAWTRWRDGVPQVVTRRVTW